MVYVERSATGRNLRIDRGRNGLLLYQNSKFLV
jgi:hypothetical protein